MEWVVLMLAIFIVAILFALWMIAIDEGEGMY